MSKNKQSEAAAVQDYPGALPEIDEFEPIELLDLPVDEGEPAGPEPDTEEAVLLKVETFATQMGRDPLAKEYDDFGSAAKATTDPIDGALLYVTLGWMANTIQIKERNLTPSSYERSKVSEKMAIAARLHGVPESMNKPHEWVAAFWVVHLDRSEPGESGVPRSFADDAIPGEWFGGNISYAVLRTLSAYIERKSGEKEMDVWDFAEGFETLVRDLIKRLRAGTLSGSQVAALLKHKKALLKAEKERTKFAGLTADEVQSLKDSADIESKNARLEKLGRVAVAFNKQAADDLKYGKKDVEQFLVNKGIILPRKAPTGAQIAEALTAGDAKLMVQTLVELARKGKRDRHDVLHVLVKACGEYVTAQVKSAKESKPAVKLAAG